MTSRGGGRRETPITRASLVYCRVLSQLTFPRRCACGADVFSHALVLVELTGATADVEQIAACKTCDPALRV